MNRTLHPIASKFPNLRNYFSCFEEWEQKTNQRKYDILASGRMMKPRRKSCVTVCDSTGKFS
jgi:hypothetical protein